MFFERLSLPAAFLFFVCSSAHSEGIKDCDSALVHATYDRTDRQFIDWRMAEQVDEGTWNEIKNSAGVNAVIYSVPIGGSYTDFKKSVQNYKRASSQSFSANQFRNVAWIGLDENSVKAYSACLQALTGKNLRIIPRAATSTDVTFDLSYVVIGNSPNPLPLKWQGVVTKKNNLPSRIIAGSTPIVVLRPEKDITLAVSGSGLGDSVVITPPPPAIPPNLLFQNQCMVSATDQPLPQLRAPAQTSWFCPALQAGDYKVNVTIKPSSSGKLRVGYGLTASIVNKKNSPVVDLVIGQIDINASNTNLPDAFQATGNTLSLADGDVVKISLAVNSAADHCCFDRTTQRDGVIQIPSNVSIELTKLN